MAKARESGMPDEVYWETFFDVDCLIERMFDGADGEGDVVEFGSGYGTFTLAAARHTTGAVFALDIEPALIDNVQLRATAQGVTNVQATVRDLSPTAQGWRRQHRPTRWSTVFCIWRSR